MAGKFTYVLISRQDCSPFSSKLLATRCQPADPLPKFVYSTANQGVGTPGPYLNLKGTGGGCNWSETK